MKVKLILVKTFSETVSWNYGDDYSDVTRHVVRLDSEFEEINDVELIQIQSYIEKFNTDKENRKAGQYLILVNDQHISVRQTINEILEKANQEQKERELKEKEKLEKKKLSDQERALKKKEALEKKLEKLKKELSGL